MTTMTTQALSARLGILGEVDRGCALRESSHA
jgi:hypothetical protein